MQDTAVGSERANKAITDLYDEGRRTFLIRYPIWLILGLSLSGVVIIALTGYLGYNSSEPLSQPWLLFLWFCAVLITLQISIFRDTSLRGRLIATLVMSLLAIVFIGITYFNQSLPDILRNCCNGARFCAPCPATPDVYSWSTLRLLGVFWLDTIRRWVRRARGDEAQLQVSNIGIGYGGRGARDSEMPSLQELVSGDLIAGALLALLLSLFFSGDYLTVHPPEGRCNHYTAPSRGQSVVCGVGGINPPTLSFLDLIQTLFYLPLGLLILALTATVSGLGALQGVNENHSQDSLVMMKPNPTGTGAVATDVTTTIIDTLRSALNRRLRLLLTNLALAFRYIGLPVLLFVATYGVAELSTNSQRVSA